MKTKIRIICKENGATLDSFSSWEEAEKKLAEYIDDNQRFSEIDGFLEGYNALKKEGNNNE